MVNWLFVSPTSTRTRTADNPLLRFLFFYNPLATPLFDKLGSWLDTAGSDISTLYLFPYEEPVLPTEADIAAENDTVNRFDAQIDYLAGIVLRYLIRFNDYHRMAAVMDASPIPDPGEVEKLPDPPACFSRLLLSQEKNQLT